MDVKTLSTIIGHVSSATTLNTYTHITDEMRRKAAVNIDQGIAGVEAAAAGEEEKTAYSEPEFTPVQPARRRPGTGYLKQIGGKPMGGAILPHLAGRGKSTPETSTASTEAECEEKLAELILQMKAEIAAPALRSQHGVSGRRQPQEEGHHRLSAGASRRDQQGHDRQRAGRGSLHGAAGTTMRSGRNCGERMPRHPNTGGTNRGITSNFAGAVNKQEGIPLKQGMPFRWSKQKSVCGISVVKREIAAVFTAAISI